MYRLLIRKWKFWFKYANKAYNKTGCIRTRDFTVLRLKINLIVSATLTGREKGDPLVSLTRDGYHPFSEIM